MRTTFSVGNPVRWNTYLFYILQTADHQVLAVIPPNADVTNHFI